MTVNRCSSSGGHSLPTPIATHYFLTRAGRGTGWRRQFCCPDHAEYARACGRTVYTIDEPAPDTPGAEPTWRITVDGWITPEAGWHSRRVFEVAATSLPSALGAVARMSAAGYLDPGHLETRTGRKHPDRSDG